MTPEYYQGLYTGLAIGLPLAPLLIAGGLWLHISWDSYQRREASKARQVRSRQVDAYFSRPGGDS